VLVVLSFLCVGSIVGIVCWWCCPCCVLMVESCCMLVVVSLLYVDGVVLLYGVSGAVFIV